MRVLVTRPAQGARRTAEKLLTMGHETILMPLTEPLHHPDAAFTALNEPHAAIALTSAEAVSVIKWAKIRNLIKPDCRFFAVGEATADALRFLGYHNIAVSGGDATDLAALIATGWRSEDPLLYLAGKPRTGTLETALAASGIPLRIAECYEMRPVKRDIDEQRSILLDHRPDAVLFYSRESARLFFAHESLQQSPEILAGMRFICISTTVASAIPQYLSKNIAIAATPDEAAIMALLSR